MHRLCSHARSRGQGIVEFAIVLPIFLLLTLGIIELGWLVYNNHTLASATREGARYAMVNGERSENSNVVSEVQDIVSQRAGGLAGPVTTAVSPSTIGEPGTQVTVSTSYEYQPIVGVMVGIGPFTLTSESTVIVQY